MNLALPRFMGAAVLAVLSVPAAAPAADRGSVGQPLWQRAIREVQKSQGLLAAKVVTHITVRDGDDVFLGSIGSVDVLVAPDKIPPTRVNVSKKSVGSPGITMELNLHLEDSPGSILEGYATWNNKGVTELSGGAVVLWEGVASPEAAGRALAYLDPDTARPQRVDLALPIHSNLGTRLVSVTIDFGPGPGDTWVPVGAVIDQSGRFMFWKRHLIITKTFQEWTERVPSGSAASSSTELTAGPPP